MSVMPERYKSTANTRYLLQSNLTDGGSRPSRTPTRMQPRLHEWSVYHSSHPDVAQNGWRKWSAEHPDWYAKKPSSTHPDWHNRRVNTVRRADYKNINWSYEYPSKPTSRTHDHFVSYTNEVKQKDTLKPLPHNKSYRGRFTYPSPFPMEVPMPKWGLYHTQKCEEPIRLDHFPPIKYDGYK
ncbi:hypothetical protein ScPMuIL_006132 [Solemya velum]